MRLSSDGGSMVLLSPMGYQFPAQAGSGDQDWDANWLIVAGSVIAEDGRRWSFRAPCLTTWEARSLTDWLRAAAAGEVAPVNSKDGVEEDDLLTFTEPTLALSLLTFTEDEAVVRVHLSLEAAPPHVSDPTDLYAFSVRLRLSLTALTAAADDWERELAPFPTR